MNYSQKTWHISACCAVSLKKKKKTASNIGPETHLGLPLIYFAEASRKGKRWYKKMYTRTRLKNQWSTVTVFNCLKAGL